MGTLQFRGLALGLLVIVTNSSSNAQDNAYAFGDSTLVKKFRLHFQVPDNPAFKALGIDPSDILRPNDIKEFAVMLSPYVGTQGFTLPQNFALEVSPGRIAARNWTVNEYNTSALRRLWANSSFSLGSRFDGTDVQDPYRTSIGYRIHFLSKDADPLRTEWLYEAMSKALVGETAMADEYLGLYADQVHAELYVEKKQRIMTKDSLDNQIVAERAAFLNWVKALHPDELTDQQRQAREGMEKDFAKRLKKFEEESWNATRLDLAVAWSGQAMDTTLKGLSYQAFHGWATAAIRPGKKNRHAQILIGANIITSADGDSASAPLTAATGNLRYYYGNNRVRGFLEGQYNITTYDREKDATVSALLFNVGVEAKITDRIGVFASTGIENFYAPGLDPVAAMKSSLDLRYFFQ